MKRAALFIIIALMLFPTILPNFQALEAEDNFEIISSGHYDKGYRYNAQGWVYIHIEGGPYERGYQYGQLASAEIVEMMYRWSNIAHTRKFMKLYFIKNLPKNYDKLSEQWWDICRSKSSRLFLKQIPDEYIDEMQGITDALNDKGCKIYGRDVDFKDVLALQFVQEVQYTIEKFYKAYNPIRNFLNGLKQIFSGALLDHEDAHCNVFIATGDATSDGGIVVSHATMFPNYVAERCNFIVDVQPSSGHRFMMTSPPGSLWSQEDWYQNEQGIMLTETELIPQGPWKIRRNLPKGVRSRTAIQYSSSIDEVIYYLEKGNNGLIPNEWIIGDEKTGEIASYMQSLYYTPIKRTFNGYYYSGNLPTDLNLYSELVGVPKFLLKLAPKLIPSLDQYEIKGNDVIWKIDRMRVLRESGEKYYGKINEDTAKEIMTTYPLNKDQTDCKITSSRLMENMGLIAYMGVLNEKTWVPSERVCSNFKGVTILPPGGWLEIYPSNSNIIIKESLNDKICNNNDTELLWNYKLDKESNINYSVTILDDDIVYSATKTGEIYSLNSKTGDNKCLSQIEDEIIDFLIYKDMIYTSTINGLYAINKETGSLEWSSLIGKITSKPVFYKNKIIVGTDKGDICYFNSNTGEVEYKFSWFNKSIYFNEINSNIIYLGSGEHCYAFNVEKNDILWGFETEGIISSAPRYNSKKVIFGSWDGNVYALDSKTGEQLWNFGTGWGIDSTPDISEGLVYIGSFDNNFYALDMKEGELKWHFRCKSAIQSSPVAYGDNVFFGCDDGRFYSLDKTNGDFKWSYTPGHYIKDNNTLNYITTPILSDPIAEDGIVYFSAKGNVYALDAQTFEKTKVIKDDEKDDYNGFIIILSLLVIVIMLLIIISFFVKKKDGMQK